MLIKKFTKALVLIPILSSVYMITSKYKILINNWFNIKNFNHSTGRHIAFL